MIIIITAHAVPPSSVSLTSNTANSFQIVGSDVLLTCTIKMNSAILGSEILLLAVGAQLSKEGTLLTLDGPIGNDTTVTYTAQLNSFQKSDFGRYICTAIVRPQPSSTCITGNDTLSDTINIEPGRHIYYDILRRTNNEVSYMFCFPKTWIFHIYLFLIEDGATFHANKQNLWKILPYPAEFLHVGNSNFYPVN